MESTLPAEISNKLLERVSEETRVNMLVIQQITNREQPNGSGTSHTEQREENTDGETPASEQHKDYENLISAEDTLLAVEKEIEKRTKVRDDENAKILNLARIRDHLRKKVRTTTGNTTKAA